MLFISIIFIHVHTHISQYYFQESSMLISVNNHKIFCHKKI